MSKTEIGPDYIYRLGYVSKGALSSNSPKDTPMFPSVGNRNTKADDIKIHKQDGENTDELDLERLCDGLKHGDRCLWDEGIKEDVTSNHSGQRPLYSVSGSSDAARDCSIQQGISTEWLDANSIWKIEPQREQTICERKNICGGEMNDCDEYTDGIILASNLYKTEGEANVGGLDFLNSDNRGRQVCHGVEKLGENTHDNSDLQSTYQSSFVWYDKLGIPDVEGSEPKILMADTFELSSSNMQTAVQDLELSNVPDNSNVKQDTSEIHSINVRKALHDLCSGSYSTNIASSTPSTLKFSPGLERDSINDSSQSLTMSVRPPRPVPLTPYFSTYTYYPVSTPEVPCIPISRNCCTKPELELDPSCCSSLNVAPKQPLLPQQLLPLNNIDDYCSGSNDNADWFMAFLDKIISSNARSTAPSIGTALQQLTINLGSLGLSDELANSINIKIKSWNPGVRPFNAEDSTTLLPFPSVLSTGVSKPQHTQSSVGMHNGQDAQQQSSNDLLVTPISSPPRGIAPFDVKTSTNLGVYTPTDANASGVPCIGAYALHHKHNYNHTPQDYAQNSSSYNAYYCFPSFASAAPSDKIVTSEISVFKKDPSHKFPSPLETPTGGSISSKSNSSATQVHRRDNVTHYNLSNQEITENKHVEAEDVQQNAPNYGQLFMVFPEISFKKPRNVNWCEIVEQQRSMNE